ncbi:hypothetical protein PoB_002558800 [Plakobranchus ocellatus]|uniref:Uncharacterized protein n=1 Tax=Plakobranchus ocellatus TaxID=259542 RepID=A0AAV3ZXE1_9GAST|nr:hypothetical protein PoB_002558800 [Plakobranchus ocellatus]
MEHGDKNKFLKKHAEIIVVPHTHGHRLPTLTNHQSRTGGAPHRSQWKKELDSEVQVVEATVIQTGRGTDTPITTTVMSDSIEIPRDARQRPSEYIYYTVRSRAVAVKGLDLTRIGLPALITTLMISDAWPTFRSYEHGQIK